MGTYNDIANTVTWSTPAKTIPVWLTPNKHSYTFIGDAFENDVLFQSICHFLQCQQTPHQYHNIDFAIIFTNDALKFFQTGKSDVIKKILFCPALHLLQSNGAFKKTLWQYMGNLGMV